MGYNERVYKIYEIRTADKKVYVGCTSTSMGMRMSKHKHLKMHFVLIPHTIEIMFETGSKEEAHKFEAYLISKYDSTNPQKGYNRRFGGSKYGFPAYVDHSNKNIKRGQQNGMFGKKHSEETREKIRQSTLARDPSTFAKNRIKTPGQLARLQEGRKRHFEKHGSPTQGKKLSEETKKKISKKMKGHKRWLGKKHSPETIQRMREAQRKWRVEKSR